MTLTPDVTRCLAGWPPQPTVEAVSKQLVRDLKARSLGTALPLVIELRKRSKVIGSLAFRVTEPRTARLGYHLGAGFQGFGYMREALPAALRAAWTQLPIDLLEAGAQPENTGSIRILESLGMSPTGLRDVFAEGRRRNEACLFYALARPADIPDPV